MQFVNFATKVIDAVVTSMLQETEKINELVRMLVWICSGCNLTYHELWNLQFILRPISYDVKIRWACWLYELDKWSTMKYY